MFKVYSFIQGERSPTHVLTLDTYFDSKLDAHLAIEDAIKAAPGLRQVEFTVVETKTPRFIQIGSSSPIREFPAH